MGRLPLTSIAVILLSVTLQAAPEFRTGVEIDARQTTWDLDELKVSGVTLKPRGFEADLAFVTLGLRIDAAFFDYLTFGAGLAFGRGEAELSGPGRSSDTSDGSGIDAWLGIGVDYAFGQREGRARQDWSPFGLLAMVPLRYSYWDFENDGVDLLLTDATLRPEVQATYTLHGEGSFVRLGAGLLADLPLVREVEEDERGQPRSTFTFDPDHPVGIVVSIEWRLGLYAIRARAEFLNEYRASIGFSFVF